MAYWPFLILILLVLLFVLFGRQQLYAQVNLSLNALQTCIQFVKLKQTERCTIQIAIAK
jgi:hypothetical protein